MTNARSYGNQRGSMVDERRRCGGDVAATLLARSVHPARFALLEERGKPIPRFGAGANFGKCARQTRAVLLPRRVGEQGEQRLDAALSVGPGLEQLAHALRDLCVEIMLGHHVMDQTDPERDVAAEPLA